MKTEIIFVKNMQCNGCVNTLTRLLMKVEGVKSVKADLVNGSLIIVYNGDSDLPAIFRKVVEEAGYPEV